MSEAEKRDTMQVFASLPEEVRRGFAAGYACGVQQAGQQAETQADAQDETETKDNRPA